MRRGKQFGEIIRDSQDFGIGSLNGQLVLRLGNTLTKSYDSFHCSDYAAEQIDRF